MPTPPTLLLADDSLTIQRVVSLTFADQSIRVVVAKDGQDAINRMASERPDLVLADTNMPCVDGYELARWVRQQPHLSAVPVLLLAGATDPVDEQRLHDSGANGVLEKPFEPSHVISRVKELLGLKTPPAAPTRLVTSLEAKPVRPTAPGRPATAAGNERQEAGPPTSPPIPAEPPSVAAVPTKPASGIFRAIATVADPLPEVQPTPVTPEPAAPADDVPLARGDARDWFAAHESGSTTPDERTSLADELGVSGPRLHGPADDARSSASAAPSNAADVFESLLAAEQGDPGAAIVRSAAPELTPEMLDALAARVVERLRPDVLRDELQRGLAHGLRETVAEVVRDSVATETRAAVADAVESAVNGTILGTVRGAVSEAVASAVPAALAHELRQAVAPLVQQTVREVVGDAVRDAVAAAVPQAVLDAVRGEMGRQVSEIVHDTAERLVREEIARIRGRQ